MITLTKESSPCWEFKSEDPAYISWLLEQCICSGCMITKKEAEEEGYLLDDPEEDFRADNFYQLSDFERINWMLGTPCGLEYCCDISS